MENTSVTKLKELLQNNDKLAIAVGKNHTLDDMAAALALYLSLTAAGKTVTVATPSDPLVEVSSLVGINKVKKSLDAAGGDLIVSFPYKEGEIEKVSYTLEDNYLNIVVKTGTGKLSFSDEEVQYRRGGEAPTLLFIIGTPRLSDLDKLFNPDTLKDTTIVNIDNKQENQGFGDVVLVSPKFSSVSEQVATLLQKLQLPFEQDSSQNLLVGITAATDNFQKSNTTYIAFEIAALLMKNGATRTKVAEFTNTFADDAAFFAPSPMPTQTQQPFRPRVQETTQHKQPQFQPRPQPTQQPKPTMPFPRQQPQPQIRDEQKPKDPQDAPPDWLTPRVYKGSTMI